MSDRPQDTAGATDEEGKGWTPADLRAARAGRRIEQHPSESAAVRRLYEQIGRAFEQFEAEGRQEARHTRGDAEHLLAGEIAEDYADVPEEAALTLTEVGRIRRAAKVAEAALPRVVLEADADGMNVAEITAELSVTESYAYRILRERDLYEYRVDVFEAGTWRDREEGEAILDTAKETEAHLAERLVKEHTILDDRHLRISVWKGRRNDDKPAYYVHEHKPTD